MIAYCDYIAHTIKKALYRDTNEYGTYIGSVSGVSWDLDADGSFKSTKKTLTITDTNGKLYTVTIEEK